ncbi:ABC transporter substrate-binding protein [Microbacteriaceae bacterium 4G12]
MNIAEHYVNLYKYYEDIQLGEQINISVEELSHILHCTVRNSNIIRKKLEGAGWIVWSSGRGRGNCSKLRFMKDPSKLLIEQSKQTVKNGNIREARQLIDYYQKDFPNLETEFYTWLHSIFGYQSETVNEQKVDVLRLAVQIPPIASLDPVHIALRSECNIVKHVSETLVRYHAETETIEPNLAFYWERNDEGTKWIFYLRKGVTFHNNKRFTAYDVEYTFNRFMKMDHPFHWLLQDMASIHVLGDYVIEIHLHEPNELFLHFLSDEHLSIVPYQDFEIRINNILVGVGPFKLVRNDESMIVLEAYDAYYRERPFLDRIELWNMPKVPSSFQSNVMWGTNPFYTNQKQEQWNKQKRLESNVTYVSFNTNKNGVMQNKQFRRILKKIINPVAMLRDLGKYRGEVANDFLRSSNVQEDLAVHDELEKCQYNGEILRLYTFQEDDHVQDAMWIQKQCAMYGIAIVISFLQANELLHIPTIMEADIIHDSATLDENLELSYLHILLDHNSFMKQHLAYHFQIEMKTALQEIFQTKEYPLRIQQLQNLEAKLLEEISFLPLYRNYMKVNNHPTVQNVSINAQGWIDFYHIWFKN